MNQVVNITRDLTGAQMSLVHRTVAKDCDKDEFDHFMAVCRSLRLDPLRKQICAMVFSKNDPKKRSMSIIVQIDGFRVIAARAGDYRPMETVPIIEIDEEAKDPDTNPLGIVRAEVRVWKRYGEQWFQVAGEAHWSEFAPIERAWVADETGQKRPIGKATIPDKSPWRRMPHVMIGKVAEAQALRRGWPDDLSGVYAEEEMAKAVVIDVASEVIDQYEEGQRLKRIGSGGQTLMFAAGPGSPLQGVARGNVADFLFSFYRNAETPEAINEFRRINEESLKTFWAWEPGDAHQCKVFAEQRLATFAEDAQ